MTIPRIPKDQFGKGATVLNIPARWESPKPKADAPKAPQPTTPQDRAEAIKAAKTKKK